jgi:signal transduction histidine kinase
MITLLFRDSGIGIPPDRLERIFEPFFSTKPNGSGLGLTLVRRVISGAGGTIFVESKPAEGTTFRILLPAV